MKGITLAEECHVINALGPIDINTAIKTSLYFNVKYYAHATIIVTMGVVTNDALIRVYESKDTGGAAKNFIGFDRYEEKTIAGDTLTTRTTAGVGGFQTGTNNTTTFVIEVDASQLTDLYHYLAVVTDNAGGGNALISVVAVLSGSRYGGDPSQQSPTAIT